MRESRLAQNAKRPLTTMSVIKGRLCGGGYEI
jgi:hypothetical protein